jgi:hypothetical protein
MNTNIEEHGMIIEKSNGETILEDAKVTVRKFGSTQDMLLIQSGDTEVYLHQGEVEAVLKLFNSPNLAAIHRDWVADMPVTSEE